MQVVIDTHNRKMYTYKYTSFRQLAEEPTNIPLRSRRPSRWWSFRYYLKKTALILCQILGAALMAVVIFVGAILLAYL